MSRSRGFQRDFAPWRKSFLTGGTLIVLALLIGILINRLEVRVVCLAVAGAGAMFISNGLNRLHGKTVESRASKALRLPEGWTATFNLPVPGMGDLDILIEAPNGYRFAIEIKSYNFAKKVWFRDLIAKRDGSTIEPDPVAQVRALGDRVNAQPVIWLPNGKGRSFHMAQDLQVILGGEWRLRWAIGAVRWGLF